jgi:transposase
MKSDVLEIEKWQNRCHELENKNSELQTLVKYYEEQFRILQNKRFGASSEKTAPGQKELPLFDEAENEAAPRKAEPAVEQITYTRRKREGKRDEDLSGLPVERVEHSLPEEERICPECGGPLHVMGHDTRRELKIIPAQVSVVEHVRDVYSCRACERDGTSVPVIKAQMPEPVIKGSVASSSSVAHIMVQKYANAMPLYRQEMDLLTNGFLLSRQTMANWLIRCSEDWLEPLYERMREHMLKEEKILHADETVLQVLKEPGRHSRTDSYMWLYRTSGEASASIVLYEYQPTRASSHPKKFLSGFNGYLHTDGYVGYHCLPPDITIVGCWAHVRRKFDEALKSVPPEERNGLPSQKGLDFCNRLFALERSYEKMDTKERYEKRLEQSKPLVNEFYAWANSVSALPKSALGRALHYALEQRPYLENIFLDGRLELSNNRAERSIKPFVIGRKNWMFSATPKGARASAIIYSVIETAKENGLKPYEYLKYLLDTIPNATSNELNSLLPWSKSIPDRCKVEVK